MVLRLEPGVASGGVASDPSKKAEALRLLAAKMSEVEVAEWVGVSRSTVRRWANPKEAERSRETSRAWKKRNEEQNRLADRIAHREGMSMGRCLTCGKGTKVTTVCIDCVAKREHVRRVLVLTALEQGYSEERIAKALRVSVPTVRQIVSHDPHEVKVQRNRWSAFSAEFRDEAVALYRERRNFQAVGEMMGCSGNTVKKWVRESEE